MILPFHHHWMTHSISLCPSDIIPFIIIRWSTPYHYALVILSVPYHYALVIFPFHHHFDDPISSSLRWSHNHHALVISDVHPKCTSSLHHCDVHHNDKVILIIWVSFLLQSFERLDVNSQLSFPPFQSQTFQWFCRQRLTH